MVNEGLCLDHAYEHANLARELNAFPPVGRCCFPESLSPRLVFVPNAVGLVLYLEMDVLLLAPRIFPPPNVSDGMF